MAEQELEVPFADLYGRRLSAIPFSGEAAAIAFAVGLLSPDFESVAANHQPANPREAFLAALAKGNLAGLTPPDSLARAIAPAFLGHKAEDDLRQLVDDGRIGEAILIAIEKIERGVQGDLDGVTDGLSLLREVGMEKAARRAALELVLLERRG
jgi:hypothetical protein